MCLFSTRTHRSKQHWNFYETSSNLRGLKKDIFNMISYDLLLQPRWVPHTHVHIHVNFSAYKYSSKQYMCRIVCFSCCPVAGLLMDTTVCYDGIVLTVCPSHWCFTTRHVSINAPIEWKQASLATNMCDIYTYRYKHASNCACGVRHWLSFGMWPIARGSKWLNQCIIHTSRCVCVRVHLPHIYHVDNFSTWGCLSFPQRSNCAQL